MNDSNLYKFCDRLKLRLEEYYKNNYNRYLSWSISSVSRNYKYKDRKLERKCKVHTYPKSTETLHRGDPNCPFADYGVLFSDDSPLYYSYETRDIKQEKYSEVYFRVIPSSKTNYFKYRLPGTVRDNFLYLWKKYYSEDEFKQSEDEVHLDDFNMSIDTSYGVSTVTFTGFLNFKNKDESIFSVHLSISHDKSEWKKYLKQNVIEVKINEETTWDDSIDELINVISTYNEEISKYVKAVIEESLTAFLNQLKQSVNKN